MIHSFAPGHGRTEERRDCLHLPGRADDADRPDAALPPRHGAHHQRRRRSHHSRESGRRVGLDLSFAGGRFLWKFPRQIPYPCESPLESRCLPRRLRRKSAARCKISGRKPSRAARSTCTRCPNHSSTRRGASLPLCHGRRAEAETELVFALAGALVLARACESNGKARKWSASCCRLRFPARL